MYKRILNWVVFSFVMLSFCPNQSLAANHPYTLVESSIRTSNYTKALQICRTILRRNPDDTRARRYAAISLYFLGYLESAEKAFRICLRDEPGNYIDSLYLAHCAISCGNLADAAHYYEQALLISPKAKEAKDGLLSCRKLANANGKFEQTARCRESKS